jgi:hypothetical protein
MLPKEKRTEQFQIRLSESDQAMFRELAERLHRSQADAIRIIVREALEVMKEKDQEAKNVS